MTRAIRQSALVATNGESRPDAAMKRSWKFRNGPVIKAALANAPNTNTPHSAARSRRLLNRPRPLRRRVVPQARRPARSPRCRCSRAGRHEHNPGRTCNPCCSTSAAGTGRARSRECRRGRGCNPWSAGRAHVRFAHLDLQRRDQRLHEIELTDRADIFAERRAAKKTVDDEGSREITPE